MENFNQEKIHSYQEAMTEIAIIRQQISVMGANDSEFSDLEIIIRELDKGVITPTEAVLRARKLQDNKQDYH